MEKSKMHKEALSRMRVLQEKYDLNPKILKNLEDEKLYYSYRVSGWSFGCIDTIDYDELYEEEVRAFEEETGNYVYHVIETKIMGPVCAVDIGNVEISNLERGDNEPITMLTFLYVSPYEEDWSTQRLEDDHLFAYVVNLGKQGSDSCGAYFGEYGYVYLTSDGGALLRRA